MNVTIIILYSLFVIMSFIIPKTHSSSKTEEYLQFRRIIYRTVNNESIAYVSNCDNIWYQDSVGITQASGVQSVQNDTKDTLFAIPLGYRFVDMRKKWVYEYRNLSDTAEIVGKYDKADSIGLTGGWNFYRKASIKFDSLHIMGDTIINDVTYQKHRYVQTFKGTRLLGEILSRCDRKGTLFQLDVGVSNAIGCPMVKGTSLTSDGRFATTSVEIEFVRNRLPDSVRRVLEAWKRNVERYPVK